MIIRRHSEMSRTSRTAVPYSAASNAHSGNVRFSCSLNISHIRNLFLLPHLFPSLPPSLLPSFPRSPSLPPPLSEAMISSSSQESADCFKYLPLWRWTGVTAQLVPKRLRNERGRGEGVGSGEGTRKGGNGETAGERHVDVGGDPVRLGLF